MINNIKPNRELRIKTSTLGILVGSYGDGTGIINSLDLLSKYNGQSNEKVMAIMDDFHEVSKRIKDLLDEISDELPIIES